MDFLDLEILEPDTVEILEPEIFKEPQPGVPFMQAGSRTCRTIIGHDDEGVLFCEGVAPLGQSWCPACRARYYVPARRMSGRAH